MNGLQLLADEVGVDERTLRRAVADGVLRARRPSPRKLELTLTEREYVRRRWGLISTLRSALRTERNVRLAVLFGSAALGTDAPDSDVDLLVDLHDASLERVLDLKAKLTGLTAREVDLVLLADAENDPSLLAQIVADGRVLVDRDEDWRALHLREHALRRRGQRIDAEHARRALEAIDRMLQS